MAHGHGAPRRIAGGTREKISPCIDFVFCDHVPYIPLTSAAMHKDFPDHHDAELVLRLYELRREPLMREARAAIREQFAPKNIAEFVAFTKAEHPLNAFYRQVGSYWEMAYGLIKHGVLHADLAMESNGEGLIMFVKVEPFLAEIRAQVNPRSFLNSEWVATQTEAGKRLHVQFAQRFGMKK
jgi:hypothetical protein